MNRTILLSTGAILATALLQPLQARPNEGHGQGGGGGRSAPQQVQQSMPRAQTARVQQAPRVQPSMPRVETRTSDPRAATQAQALALQERSRTDRTPSNPQTRTRITNNTDNNVRNFQRENRQAPTIAFGGSASRNVERNVNDRDRNDRRFNDATTTRNFDRSDFRHARPPLDIYRNWDRHSIHTWNHNRYRWYGNEWIILGGGYDTPYYTDDSVSYYDSAPAPMEYAATGDLATSVQGELARRGYDPGAVDGVIGPQTRNAIAQFQNDRGLAVTGRIDRALINALDL